MKNPRHLLLKGTAEIEKIKPEELQSSESQTLGEYIRNFPPETGIAICNHNMVVLFSNMQEISVNSIANESFLQQIIIDSSNKYWYQITNRSFGEQDFYILNRIPNHIQRPQPKIKIVHFFFFTVLILTITLFIIILLIFRSISHSITYLKNYTEEIASGKYEENTEPKPVHMGNEIIAIADSIEKVRISLMEAQNQKNKFIMGISHDLRTPVAIVKGYTEAIKDGIISDPDEVAQTFDLIIGKTNQLERMVDTLINFVKLNNIENRENLVCQSITKIIYKFAEDSVATGSVFKRNITADIELDKDYLTPLNKDLAERAFQNIFGNALRYTKEDDSIIISAYEENKKIYFSISDTGCGISEEDMPNIFELFYRATSSRREEGMGIGLSVVKNILDNHGWSIDVKSKVNEGSTFTITIPIECEDELIR
ncbi:MAG: HAMP domain-containing histidine kinase [Treponema sp.]|nr:HAMP domain-containing histidine kinase [Treponema sp.]